MNLDPQLRRAADLLSARRLAEAEVELRTFLSTQPDTPQALWLLANVTELGGRHVETEQLLKQAAPHFPPARFNLATFYHNHRRGELALPHIDRLLADEPGSRLYMMTKAAILRQLYRIAEAAPLYEAALGLEPNDPEGWAHYGHTLRVLGKADQAIAAYRKALSLSPAMGRTWWSLADMKVVQFTDDDISAMREALEDDIGTEDRTSLHFALGAALESQCRYEDAFHEYASGNALRRRSHPYDPAKLEDHVRGSAGALARGPADWSGAGVIFVLGLPRSGSTLVEQILASHSAIEGTSELPYIPALARDFPKELTIDQRRQLRSQYLALAAKHRRTERPFFIDKRPDNWQHIAFIEAILPDAKIIDVRRDPMACGFSNYKQLFSKGQEFSSSLEWIGHYYRQYVEMLAAADEALPGRVYRVSYEKLVEDIAGETRRLLDYLGLPFEAACTRFHENGRQVISASSEQVRRPINREGIEQWRHFDPWLEPLKRALRTSAHDPGEPL